MLVYQWVYVNTILYILYILCILYIYYIIYIIVYPDDSCGKHNIIMGYVVGYQQDDLE